QVAVPADDVERVVVEHVGLITAANPNLHWELALLAHRVQVRRRMDVAVVVRRSFQELPVLVAIAPRNLDQPRRLEHEVALIALGAETIRRAARDHDVVPFFVRHGAEDRFERPRAFLDGGYTTAL